MKNFTILGLALTSLLLTSCNSGTPKEKLYFYNWGDYIDEDLVSQFEDEYNVEVVSEYFTSNEDMYQKLKNGGGNYDVIIPSDYMVEKLINEDMLEPINFDNIPNYDFVEEYLKDVQYDKEGKYSVPYMWGTVGILYNTDMVTEPVDSWSILWDEKYSNNIFMYNSQRDSLAVALKLLGYSLNTTDTNELNEAKQLLIEQKPLVQAYVGDNVKDKMIGDEGALAVVYSGDAVYCQMENPSLNYIVPKEGSNIWVDAMVIPKSSQNKELAEKFINFLSDPEVAKVNTEYIGFTTANADAIKLLDQEIISLPGFIVDSNNYSNMEIFVDLGASLSLYDEAWTEVLASN